MPTNEELQAQLDTQTAQLQTLADFNAWLIENGHQQLIVDFQESQEA